MFEVVGCRFLWLIWIGFVEMSDLMGVLLEGFMG